MRMLNKSLKILLITDVLVLIAGAMIVPFYAIFVEKIGGDILEAGIAAGVFAITAGVVTLVAGRVSDRIERKERIVAASYLVLSVGFMLYILVDSIWFLLAVQVLIGLAQACYVPAYDALYTAHAGGKRLASSRWSMWEASNYFAIAIGAVLGAIVVKFGSFTALFLAMASLCLLSSLYLFSLSKRRL